MTHISHRRLLLLAWAATRAVLLLSVLKVFTVPGPDVTTDVSVIYHGWSAWLRTGVFPPDDVTWQYPPGAALAVLSPVLLPFLDYPVAFFLLVCAADGATLALLLRAVPRGASDADERRTPAHRRHAGVWVWIVGVPLLGPTAYARYDVMVAAVAVASLLAAPRRPLLAGALAGFGALLKVWPALLLIGTPRGYRTRRAWGAAVLAGLLIAGGFALTMPGAFAFLAFQRERGVEVESVGSLVFHVARQYGWEGEVLFHYGSIEFLGPYVDVVGTVSLALTAVALAWLLWWRLRAVAWTGSTPADAAFAAVLLFTTTSRVISPQYMIWLVALAAVCMTLRAGRQGLPTVLVLMATGVTLLEFPIGFHHVVASDAWGVALIALRNGLLIAASLVCCARLWRSTVTDPRRRAADDGVARDRAPVSVAEAGGGASGTGDPGGGASGTGGPGGSASVTGGPGGSASGTGDPGGSASGTGDPGGSASGTGDPGGSASGTGDPGGDASGTGAPGAGTSAEGAAGRVAPASESDGPGPASRGGPVSGISPAPVSDTRATAR